MLDKYKEDLAWIHDEGFYGLAVNGANELLSRLQEAGVESGKIVDLGCGSGVAATKFVEAGFEAIGVDTSQSLIEIARDRVPEAEFHVGSFLDFQLPDVVAVCALGEVFNYSFDTRNSEEALKDYFCRVFDALVPKGLFLFDTASQARASEQPSRTFTDNEDWSVLMESVRTGGVLTRRIITYRKMSDHYRKNQEVHNLNLVEPSEILAALQSAGFVADKIGSYDTLEFPAGLHGYCAYKK